MAISKDHRQGGPVMPDAAAFVKVIEEGMADPIVVSRAYREALLNWHREGGRVETRPEDVVQSRAAALEGADPDSPAARMITLGRTSTFLGRDTP